MVSRQRKWQLKKQAEGKCTICGKEAWKPGAYFCPHHLECQRSRSGSKPWKLGGSGRVPRGQEEVHAKYVEEKVEAGLIMLNSGCSVCEAAKALGVCDTWLATRITLIKTWVAKEEPK
jgi:hypothetical protein